MLSNRFLDNTIRSQRYMQHAFMTAHLLLFLMVAHFGANQNAAAATPTQLPARTVPQAAAATATATAAASPPTASLVAANDLPHSTNNDLNSENFMMMMTPGQKVMAAVPLEDQNDFILYHLSMALAARTDIGNMENDENADNDLGDDNYEQRFGSIIVYDSFDDDLLNWVMLRFNATELNVCVFVRSKNRLCTSNGVCYTQDDIGCYCCPF